MKILLLVLLFVITGLSQEEANPQPVYTKNNVLIAISGMSPKYNCGIRTFTGFFTKVGNDYPDVYADIKTSKGLETVEFDLSVLSNVDRANLYFFILKKYKKIEIEGYTCGSNGIIDVISIRSLSSKINKSKRKK